VVRIGDRWIFVESRARWAPSCYMPPDLRGQPVLMLDGEALFARLPEAPCQPDSSEIQVALELAADGTARGRVTETHRGVEALRWRSLLGRTPEAERQGVVEESHTADVLPGAELVALRVRDEERVDRPLVVELEIQGIRLGEPLDERRLRLVLPYRSELVEGFATLPTRTTPLVVRSPVREVVDYEITLPQGARAATPRDSSTINPLAEMQLNASFDRESSRLELRRQLEIRTGRVAPAAYPAFSAFCQEVDRLEAQPIEIDLDGSRRGE
jgi:hypothetical protein